MAVISLLNIQALLPDLEERGRRKKPIVEEVTKDISRGTGQSRLQAVNVHGPPRLLSPPRTQKDVEQSLRRAVVTIIATFGKVDVHQGPALTSDFS